MDSIKNKNLLRIMHLVQNYGETIPEEYLDELYYELSFSVLICPFIEENSIQLMCHESSSDDFFIPAFTSLEVYYDFFKSNIYMPDARRFLDLKASVDDSLVGILINPASDDFFIEKSYLDNMNNVVFPESKIHDIKKSEFKEYLKSTENNTLLDAIKSDKFTGQYNPDKFKKFLDEVKNQGLFVMLTTSDHVKGRSKDKIYHSTRIKNIGYHILVNASDDEYILAFTDEKSAVIEDSHRQAGGKFFITPMSFTKIVENALNMDCDGIIINHSSNPVFLHRDLLIKELDNIIKYSNNSELASLFKFVKMIK